MKKKHVPEKNEEREAVPLDVQVLRLTELSSNQHFSNLRGMLGGEFLAVMAALKIKTDGSVKAPSRYYTDLKKGFCSSLPIVFEKLAQLERDGYDAALQEAIAALKHPEYRMLGEVEPYDKTVPITLVLFNPEETFSYFKGKVFDYKEYGGGYIIALEKSPFTLENELYDFTTTNKHCADRIWRGQESLIKKLRRFGRIKYHRGSNYTFNMAQTLPLDETYLNIKQAKPDTGLAYAFKCEQKHLLSAFNRKEQERIATWQFHLPVSYIDKDRLGRSNGSRYGGGSLNFGLHLETEHPYWKKHCEPFCSIGLSAGHGAIAWPNESYCSFFDKSTVKYRDKRVLLEQR